MATARIPTVQLFDRPGQLNVEWIKYFATISASSGVTLPINLASQVTGNLPYANLTSATAASRLFGRGSASGAGNWQEITLGSGLSMTGTVLTASGSGDVVGPSSSTDEALVRFDGTTGKLIQDYSSGAPTAGDTGIVSIPSGLITPTIEFPTVYNGDGYTYASFTNHEAAAGDFYINGARSLWYGARYDYALLYGYNQSEGGSNVKATEPALFFAIESHYQQDATHLHMELYYQYNAVNYANFHRPWFVQCHVDTDTNQQDFTSNAISFNLSAGVQKAKMDLANNIFYFTGGMSLLGLDNNVKWLQQMNAASSGFINIAKLDANDNLLFGQSTTLTTKYFDTLFCLALGLDNFTGSLTGTSNIGIGYSTLKVNTSGASNVALGSNSLLKNTTGSNNFALGTGALKENVSGGSNVGIGTATLGLNTGSNNLAIGFNSMFSNTSGGANVGIGTITLYSNTTESDNTAIGYGALYLATASENTAIGRSTMGGTVSGIECIGIGPYTLYTCSGIGNIGIGYDTLDTAGVSGDYNIVIGYNSGSGLTSGSRNIVIGKQVTTPAANSTDRLNIGGLIKGLMAGTKVLTVDSAQMVGTTTTFTNGAAASAGTLLNAPAAGNPTKWIPIDDNGTLRYIPSW